MAIGAVHFNGLGQSLGDSLVVSPGGPIVQSGAVWYVDSQTGNSGNDGVDQKSPLATLAQAQTAATSGDIVVLLSGHAETLTSPLTISKQLVIVGAGSSDGKPTVKFTNNQSANSLMSITGEGVELRNIWFEEEAQANSAVRISVSGDHFRMVDCYVECNENSNAGAVSMNLASDEGAEIRGTTFVSTATDNTDPPVAGLVNSNDGFLRVVQCVFDGGTVGFSGGYGFSEEYSTPGFTAGLYMDSITCLRGADLAVHNSSVFFVQVSSDSDDPRIDITSGAA